MKIALINENSQAAKNGIIEAALKKVVEPMGHEVVNYGMYAADDAAQLTYVQCGILAAILLNSGAADYVITGCGTGEGAMLALNSFPGVICGHVEDPVDAYTFAHVNDGNAVAMPWIKDVPAVVQGWFIGSEAGNAITDVLSGDVNPSGKLPFTFPMSLADVGAHAAGEYPGNKAELDASKEWGDTIREYYNDDIFVGYRWADKEKTTPLFPFGHGLSYTSFEYGKPTADKKVMTADDIITVSVNVKNTGSREGSEIVQLYIADKKSSLPRPVKELKGFEKIYLQPNESRTVRFTIAPEMLKFYNADLKFVAEPGDFDVMIGPDSRNVKTARFTLR